MISFISAFGSEHTEEPIYHFGPPSRDEKGQYRLRKVPHGKKYTWEKEYIPGTDTEENREIFYLQKQLDKAYKANGLYRELRGKLYEYFHLQQELMQACDFRFESERREQ